MDLGAVFERSRENSLAFTLSLLLSSDVFETSLWFFDFCGPLATYTLSLLLFMSPRTPIMYHAKYTRYKKNKTNKDFVLNDKTCFQNILEYIFKADNKQLILALRSDQPWRQNRSLVLPHIESVVICLSETAVRSKQLEVDNTVYDQKSRLLTLSQWFSTGKEFFYVEGIQVPHW